MKYSAQKGLKLRCFEQVVQSRKYPFVGGAKIFCRFVYKDLREESLINLQQIIYYIFKEYIKTIND